MEKLETWEFKSWFNTMCKDAKDRGFTDEQILIELLEQTRFYIIRQFLKQVEIIRKEVKV